MMMIFDKSAEGSEKMKLVLSRRTGGDWDIGRVAYMGGRVYYFCNKPKTKNVQTRKSSARVFVPSQRTWGP